jgi:murein DD-endopeptidase MepM/ murein hydrolase activator NlpD
MMFKKRLAVFAFLYFLTSSSKAQSYPQDYFRNPLNIPLQLVANFGEIRTHHWHMGLDIRTQQKVNLPVYAAADGYIARVSVEPGGFGQAIYINHPNGYTTLYGHLNAFFPALQQYVKSRQYEQQSWRVNLELPPGLFLVKKGDFIALSGSTGASEGPHVHFEIRDTKTENCLNPLLFHFPITDAVPPTLFRLALYDRNKSTYAQAPQLISLKKTGQSYALASLLKVGSDKISFAIGAVDRFSGSANSNGIYSAAITVDGQPLSEFVLDNISYTDTRYINAQIDYPYKSRGGASLQHISPLPGEGRNVYRLFNEDGIVKLTGNDPHEIVIEVKDAAGNRSQLRFFVQYDPALQRSYSVIAGEKFLPGNLNIFERGDFELVTTEYSIYDTVAVSFSVSENNAAAAASPLYSFLNASIPSHDSVTVRIKPTDISAESKDKVIIKNVSGTKTFVEKAGWQKGWAVAKFRQFGTYQAFVDAEPPTVNAPQPDLTRASRIIFIPKDNFNTIKSFRAEVDGQWLRFTNDKGKSWIYTFDEHFPKGDHELKVIVEDEAGNITMKTWNVKR